jgi:glycosyltransferase involved in cell wall biosynthesis
MRILHVIANLAPETGGPATACPAMAAAMAARGHEVAVFTTAWSPAGRRDLPDDGRRQEDGVAYRYFDYRGPARFTVSAGLARALMREAGSFDVVHLHSLYLFHDWAAGRACRAAGTPYILRPHGTFLPFGRERGALRKRIAGRLFQDRVTAGASLIHLTSQAEAEEAEPFVFGRPRRVVPLGFELARLQRPTTARLERAFPALAGGQVVLFLGRLAPQKGLDLLMLAFATAAQGRPDWHLLLAGPDGGLQSWLEGEVARLGLEGRVHFAGMIEGGAKAAALRQSALFALPSYGENFGIATLEALAVGTPVLVSDRVALCREIEADGSGVVCPPTVASVTEALVRLMADEELRARLGRAGAETTAPRFDWAQVAPRLEALYQEAVELGPPEGSPA